MAVIKTDVLIVGAGPAGGAAALFLSHHGVTNMVISRHRSTADTPRAHITNQRTMEALRDAGLERDCMAHASPSDFIEHSFWLRSMVGEELARTWTWGNDPRRKGDYEAASPCRMCDLPQTELEPLLIAEAARLGSHVRFSTELMSFDQNTAGVTATLRDRLSGEPIEVVAKYMIGADGARSRVVDQLGLPISGKHGLGDAFNVLVDVDLSPYVTHRRGSLYSIIQPSSSTWAPIVVFRMVKPWHQWLVSMVVPPTSGRPSPTLSDFEDRIRETVGSTTIPIRVLSTSVWQINDVVAEQYSLGRVFCMGDAVHRHPPSNGLGSNTCIQDAFNLSWKLALVTQGKAAPSLLDSYNDERQPVGRQVVARANKSMVLNNKVWNLFGGGTPETHNSSQQASQFDVSDNHSLLRESIAQMQYVYHAHGVELNRAYSSQAVVDDGVAPVDFMRDPELYYRPSTCPGASLPHAWLGHRDAGPRVSTLDVAGKRRFCLMIGSRGQPWREAANHISARMDVEVVTVAIGPGLDFEDLYGQWAELSGVEESGCVLVRPDLHVAWRCNRLAEAPLELLSDVMTRILGL